MPREPATIACIARAYSCTDRGPRGGRFEEPRSLLASIEVVHHPDGERDDRATLGVELSNTKTDAVLRVYTAVPLDGCRGLTAPFMVGALVCDPWKVSVSCCQPIAFQTPAPAPTAGDEDAGPPR